MALVHIIEHLISEFPVIRLGNYPESFLIVIKGHFFPLGDTESPQKGVKPMVPSVFERELSLLISCSKVCGVCKKHLLTRFQKFG